MFIDDATITRNGKTYRRVLLRNSYRLKGKIRHDTIANLSGCTDEEIEAIKLALKHKGNLRSVLSENQAVRTRQGLCVGAVWALSEVAKQLGITKALGKSRKAKLALWLVMANVIEPGSRLSAVRLAQRHAVCDVLGLGDFCEDDLYLAMDWLAERQAKIEASLFAEHYRDNKPQLYLYDVTSSYLEGEQNELARYGHNRDGKKGKMQIVVGLLTDELGWPISVEVFEGNTQDPATFKPQIEKMAGRFGVTDVTFVGDRGMIKSVQISDLADKHFHYITAITRPQMNSLVQAGVLQVDMFDDELVDVESADVRYVLRRNPKRALDVAGSRQSKLASVHQFASRLCAYLAGHPRAEVAVAIRKLNEKTRRLKVNEWVGVQANDRALEITVDTEAMVAESRWDGCYVIKTDLPVRVAPTQVIHDRYKDLTEVEFAFRTMKTTLLEMRGIYVRKANHTRAHVLTIMLAYQLVYHLRRCWHDVELTVEEGIAELASICATEVLIAGNASSQTIPQPRKFGKELLSKANVTLPDAIPCLNANVVTRKTLAADRKPLL